MRDFASLVGQSLRDIEDVLAAVDVREVAALIDAIEASGDVFVVGAGRTGGIMGAFAQRLMHLGTSAHVAGETTTPRARPGNLLVAASGSGERRTVLELARIAQEDGVRVAAVTGDRESPLARVAELTLVVPWKARVTDRGPHLGASLFEQSLLVLLDAVATTLAERKGADNRDVAGRHANLE